MTFRTMPSDEGEASGASGRWDVDVEGRHPNWTWRLEYQFVWLEFVYEPKIQFLGSAARLLRVQLLSTPIHTRALTRDVGTTLLDHGWSRSSICCIVSTLYRSVQVHRHPNHTNKLWACCLQKQPMNSPTHHWSPAANARYLQRLGFPAA